MKTLRVIFCILVACATNSVSAEETGGFWGWLTGVTSSAWEGTKSTVRSIFGGKADEQAEPAKKETMANGMTQEEAMKKDQSKVTPSQKS